ncbi:MAG: AAA family ATPase [Acidimicrobiales bacterium]
MEPVDDHARCPDCGRLDDVGKLGQLFIITGASGSGKSAISTPLARSLAGTAVTIDTDLLLDSATALAGDGRAFSWPAFRDAWLAVAHAISPSGTAVVLLGPFIPDHLEGLPARRWIGEIRFLLLDCPDQVRRARLESRPPWRSREFDAQLAFAAWLREHIDEHVDTSKGSPQDAATAVARWVRGHWAPER